MRIDLANKGDLIEKPHVVLLGAGASRAAFPNGDANGKKLPVMDDFIETLNLNDIFNKTYTADTFNFEAIYPQLENSEKKILEKRIFDYFSQLAIPTTATIYDCLLLSLRKKDAIFTFNWDPFLFDAYQRNRNIISLPEIFFLHGNVRICSCLTHDIVEQRQGICRHCNKRFSNVPLLYPIDQKDYISNKYIKSSWDKAEYFFSNAFALTMFGFGAPISDTGAIRILNNAWYKYSKREFEHIEIIDILDISTLTNRWKTFSPTYHINPITSYDGSSLWRWPRRSCEALALIITKGEVVNSNPLLQTNNLAQLQQSVQKLLSLE